MACLRCLAFPPRSNCKLLPVRFRSEAFEVRIGVSVERDMGDSNNAAKSSQRLFIDLVPTKQVRVVTEVAQEPMQFPKGSGAGVHAAAENLAGVLAGLKNRKSQDEEGLVRMPAIERLLDPDE